MKIRLLALTLAPCGGSASGLNTGEIQAFNQRADGSYTFRP
jgi:hypothetical protein